LRKRLDGKGDSDDAVAKRASAVRVCFAKLYTSEVAVKKLYTSEEAVMLSKRYNDAFNGI